MTTATTSKPHTKRAPSAFPPDVEALLPEARKLMAALGGAMPSARRVMKELRIGAPKARQVLARLAETKLHLVTENDRPAPTDDDSVPAEVTRNISTPVRTPVTDQASDMVLGSDPDEPWANEAGGYPAYLAHGQHRVPIAACPYCPIDEVDEPASAPAEDATPPKPATVDARDTEVDQTAEAAEESEPAGRPVRAWPLLLLIAPAMVAIWAGWVGLGKLAGFGPVDLLPGIWDGARVDTSITLPVGMETYAAFALRVLLSRRVPGRARKFARWSVACSLGLGAAGQVVYHVLTAAGITQAPWPITVFVACLPVAVLGMGAALAHLLRDNH